LVISSCSEKTRGEAKLFGYAVLLVERKALAV
jgi:hypothetical protein